MSARFSPLAVLLVAIVWRLNVVPVSAVTVHNLRLVEHVRFTDVLPRNGTHYIDSLDDVSITMCALQCVIHLPYCSAILYNGGQGSCKLLKSHLSECLVDRTSLKTGWKLYINDKACDDQWVPYNGHCYLFEGTTFTMKDAEKSFQTRCKDEKAYMVEIDTSEENTWILENFLEKSPYNEECNNDYWSWIGLTDRQEEGVFISTRQNQMTWTDWEPGEPNDGLSGEDCVIIATTPSLGSWNDVRCNKHQSFICEKSM